MEKKGGANPYMASDGGSTVRGMIAVRPTRRGWAMFGHGPGYWLGHIPLALILLFVLFWTFLPVLWTITTSFKSMMEYYRGSSISLIPRPPTLHNYTFMFKYLPQFPTYFRNSMIVTLSVVVINVTCASLMGYAFARMTFRGRDLLFYSMVISMFIPRAGALMAVYKLMDFLHLRDSLIGLIFYFSAHLSVSLFIMRQTFLGLPRELEESAMIDGASRLKIFTRIAVPYASAGMLVVAVLIFVNTWGDYLFTITMVDTASKYTLGVGIAMATGVGSMAEPDPEITEAGIQSAAYLLTAAPAILLYLVLQRYFVRGLMEGALKF